VVNVEAEAPEVAADTTVVVYMVNQGEAEYSPEIQASKYNYRHFLEEKGLRKWKVEAFVGNDVEPTILWSANREGAFIAAIGQYEYFDSHNCFGGGVEVGYLRKNFGFSIYGTMGNGYEAKSSKRGGSFRETDAGARLYSPVLETNIGRDILSLRAYAGANFKKRQDLQYEKNSSVSVEEIEIGEEKGTEITTVVRTSRLDARPHVFGFEIGGRLQYDIWGSPISFFLTADWGKSQNFSYMEKQWHNQFKCQIGISYRLFNSHGYNKQSIKKLGYTEREVKRYNL
jgi:hypothetical protein